jgi:hypothetical protein
MYDRLLRLIVRAVRLPRRVQPKGYLLFHAGFGWADKVSVNCPKSSDYITVGKYFLYGTLSTVFRNEQSQEFTYTTRWDSDKIKGCQCDYPATGYDCSQQLCPPGDDPLTPGQVGNLGAARELV